jgi:hypothetical protein
VGVCATDFVTKDRVTNGAAARALNIHPNFPKTTTKVIRAHINGPAANASCDSPHTTSST